MEHGQTRIVAGGATLDGNLIRPEGTAGVVLFAHGSGSSRSSPRNQEVAEIIRQAGLGTLLFDLLTPEEASRDSVTAELRFDVRFLAERLLAVTGWLRDYLAVPAPRLGYFGASTGAAAALVAAASPGMPGAVISAIVSRGGRPDLAGDALPRVAAPTLLIVGELDAPVVKLNREAYERLRCEKRLAIVPGASHLFEEPGTLDRAARLASEWLEAHLTSTRS